MDPVDCCYDKISDILIAGSELTLYSSGDFETARQYAIRGVQLWRSSSVHSPVEELHAPVVLCLCWEALSEWHTGEIDLCHTNMAEAISLAKQLNDTHGLALALWLAGFLAHFERNPAEVERLASDLIALSTRQNFALWLAGGDVLRGWARSVYGDTAESISWIEDGIEDWRATGSLQVPYYQPTQNTAAKKRVCQEAVDSDCLFDERLQRAVSRFGWGKSSAIKQTLEMQSEDTSATRYSLKWAC